jgi:uncharacterized protein (DUF305 family)
MHKLTLTLTLALLTVPAVAQDHAGHGMMIDLPPVCLATAGEGMPAMSSMQMAMPSPAHEDLMAGMDRMNMDMMAGGTAADIDVAFICSMIPHHRGAIDMAEAELANGDDPFARELAEAIIAAQEKEIADMLAWLETQAE